MPDNPMVSIAGLNKADVLAALYNRSKAQGLGVIHASGRAMTRADAARLLDTQTYFDYVSGRVMKVDLSSDTEFDPRLYDRDLGDGAAQAAVDAVRSDVARTAAVPE